MTSLSSTNEQVDNAFDDDADTNYLVGVVVDNEDPLGINRIKVTVPNMFSGDPQDLPWIGPLPHSPFGIGSGYGVYGSPAIGSEVAIKLQNNDAHYGILEGSLLTVKNANPKFKSPKRWGFKDPDGNELFVDMENHAWEFTTHTGTFIKHDAEGNLNIHVTQDEVRHVTRDQTTTVDRNVKLTVGGNMVVEVTGDMQATVSGNAAVNVSGSTDLTSGGDTSVTASNANVDATTVTVTANTFTVAASNIQLG
jgi:hypothetical protein